MNRLFILLFVLGFLAMIFGSPIMRKINTARVQQKGIDARARVLELKDTGNRRNKNPVVTIKLMVTDPTGREFPGEVEMAVSPVYMSRYQPGKTVSVKYLPDSPSKMIIEE
jgi:hypothetical protein